MTAEPNRARDIFIELVNHVAPEEWDVRLPVLCESDEKLQSRVKTLLQAHAESGSFLEQPALGPTTDPRPTVNYSPPEQKPGDRIGRYKLLQEIGEGGFGVVYMAEQTEPVHRKVALKVIKPGMDTKEVIARFEAERQALALMDHTNIARVLDAGATDSGRPYFVMELVKGIPITDYCDRHKLDTRSRLELFIPVCRAVQHAHQKGVIHRDLKPSNVMVTLYDGTPVPKVIDFGIAKATSQKLTEKTLFTSYGQFIGTPQYMSPEQSEHSALDIDTRSDIYALGAMLYELLSGRPPFDPERLKSAGFVEVLRIIREEDPLCPSQRLSTLDEEATTIADHRHAAPASLSKLLQGDLDWIVMKALEKDRARRYETADALATDVARYLSHDPVEAGPPSSLYVLRKYVHKHFRVISTAALFAAILIVATAVSSWLAVRNDTLAKTAQKLADENRQALIQVSEEKNEVERQRSQANQRLQQERRMMATMKVKEAQKLCESGHVNRGLVVFAEGLEVAQIADDRALAEACSMNLTAWTREAHTLVHMFEHPMKVNCVAVSPDGKILATACQDGAVRCWDLSTGQQKDTLLEHPAPVNTLVFHPDSSKMISGCEDGVVRLWDLGADGFGVLKAQFIHAAPEKNPLVWKRWKRRGVSSISISADGTRMATGGYDSRVHIWDLEKPAAALKTKNLEQFVTCVAFDPQDQEIVAATGNTWNVHFWNWNEGKTIRKIDLDAVSWQFDFHSAKRHLVVGTMQKHRVLQFDSTNGRRIGKVLHHLDGVSSVRYSPDGELIVSTSADSTALVWDADSGRRVGSVIEHPRTVTSSAWSPNSKLLITGCDDGTVRVWKLAEGILHETLVHQGSWIRDVNFSPNSSLIITCLEGGANPAGDMYLWDAMSGQRFDVPLAIRGWTPTAIFDQSGKVVLVSGNNVKRYDIATGILTGETSSMGYYRMAWSPDGKHLATSSSYAPVVRRWNATTLEPIGPPLRQKSSSRGTRFSFHIWKHHAGDVAFVPDSELILVGGGDGNVQLWNFTTGKTIGTPHHVSSGVHALAFMSDGNTFAVGNSDGSSRLWDMKTWKPLGSKMKHEGKITDVCFTPDQRLLLTSSVDSSARMWHAITGLTVGPPLWHTSNVNAVKCNPTGRWAATAGDDAKAKIWHLPHSETYEAHKMELCVAALTGLKLDPSGSLTLLTPTDWAEAKSKSAETAKILFRKRERYLPEEQLPGSWIYDTLAWSRSKQRSATDSIVKTAVDLHSQLVAIELLRRQDTDYAAKAISKWLAENSSLVRLQVVLALQGMSSSEARRILHRKTVSIDEFDGASKLNWRILKSVPSRTWFDKQPGTLTIKTHGGDFYEQLDDYKNVYLISNPAQGQDFQLTCCIVGFSPSEPSQQAALLCWIDEDNYIEVAYEAGAPKRQHIVLASERGGLVSERSENVLPTKHDRLWLRLTRVGNRYAYSSSTDGEKFTLHGSTVWDGEEAAFVGLTAMSPGVPLPQEVEVSFDFFEVATLSTSESP